MPYKLSSGSSVTAVLFVNMLLKVSLSVMVLYCVRLFCNQKRSRTSRRRLITEPSGGMFMCLTRSPEVPGSGLSRFHPYKGPYIHSRYSASLHHCSALRFLRTWIYMYPVIQTHMHAHEHMCVYLIYCMCIYFYACM